MKHLQKSKIKKKNKQAQKILEQHWRKKSTKNKKKSSRVDLKGNLFENKTNIKNQGHLLERIIFEEVIYKLKSKKNQKVPEKDQVTNDLPESLLMLMEWYNVCFEWEIMPVC